MNSTALSDPIFKPTFSFFEQVRKIKGSQKRSNKLYLLKKVAKNDLINSTF